MREGVTAIIQPLYSLTTGGSSSARGGALLPQPATMATINTPHSSGSIIAAMLSRRLFLRELSVVEVDIHARGLFERVDAKAGLLVEIQAIVIACLLLGLKATSVVPLRALRRCPSPSWCVPSAARWWS